MAMIANKLKIPEDLARCVAFHGHICPGLVYGYRVAKEAMKRLKVEDLLMRPFEGVFTTTEVPFDEPHDAPLERSEPCAICGDMTMSTKMVKLTGGRRACTLCSQKG